MVTWIKAFCAQPLATLRSTRLTLRHTVLDILRPFSGSWRARKQGSVDIEALHALEWSEHRRQEQLCVPLVPADTYWYLSATPELVEQAVTRLEALYEVES